MAKDPALRKQNDLAREVDRLLRQLPFADPMLRGDPATTSRPVAASGALAGAASRPAGTIARGSPLGATAQRAPIGAIAGRAPAGSIARRAAAGTIVRRAPAEPSALAQTISAWLRALLAAALGASVSVWPYASDCGWMLYLALFVIAMVIMAGVWAGTWAWRLRVAPAHVLSLVVLAWGVVLAAEQVLPRSGYAAVTAAWTCVAR